MLTIVIPVYNEGENITTTIRDIEAKVICPHRVVIVYDFDGDTTVPVAQQLANEVEGINLLKNRHGRGALNAIRTGIESVSEGLVLVAMADLSDDLSVVPAMVAKAEEGYDIVCGSRYTKGGRQIGGPFLKKTMSRFAGVSLHYVAGIPTKDITNSFKLYRREIFEKITIESRGGFEIGMETVVKAYLLGYRIAEVPSTWRDRTEGESRFRLWKWLPKYLHWYWFAVSRGRLFGFPPKALQSKSPKPL